MDEWHEVESVAGALELDCDRRGAKLVRSLFAELRAARALIAGIPRLHEEGKYYDGASCTACGEVASHEREYFSDEEDERGLHVGFRIVLKEPIQHKPGCAWATYDQAVKRLPPER